MVVVTNGFPRDDLPSSEQVDEASQAQWGSDWLFIGYQLGMLLRRAGWDLRGFSFSLSRDKWTLCVRVTHGDTQQVVFVSQPDPLACVTVFRRKYNAGTLAFYPDKFLKS